MKSSPLILILSIATAVSCLEAKVTQYTVNEYNNRTPFLSFFAQNRFLNLPGPPSSEVKGLDLIEVKVPAPLETYLWELTGYYQAEATAEYTFSIGETKAAGIQLGEKNSASLKFNEINLGGLSLFTENSVSFSLEKDGYYPVKITYISGSERVPIYITVDGKKVALNDQIMNLSADKIVDNSNPKLNEVDEKSTTPEEPKEIKEFKEIKDNLVNDIQTQVGSQVAAVAGDIKKSINSQIDETIPGSSAIDKSELENQLKDVIESGVSSGNQQQIPSDIDERIGTLGGIQSNTKAKDGADVGPLESKPKIPSTVDTLAANANKAETPIEEPVLNDVLTNNVEKEKVEGVDGAKITKDVPKDIDQKKLDETPNTAPDLTEKQLGENEAKKLVVELPEKVDPEKLKNDPKASTSKNNSKRDSIDGLFYQPTGFSYSLKLVTEGLDLKNLLKDHSQLMLLEVGFFDSRYTGFKHLVDAPYITEIIGHAQAPIAGTYQIVMTDKVIASIQMGPGVTEKQTQYTIDNMWTIMDNRGSVQGEVILQPGLFYPFRMVLIAQLENSKFDFTLFDPNGAEVDLFEFWQAPEVEEVGSAFPSENDVTSINSGLFPAISVANFPGVSDISSVAKGNFNISNGTTSEYSPIAPSIQGSNVADLSLGPGSSGHSSISFNAHAHLSASLGFPACVSGYVCVSSIHPSLVHTGTLVVEDKPTKYFSRVEADQFSTPTSSPERGSLQASANISGSGTVSGATDGKPWNNGENGKPSENGDIMDTSRPNNRLNDSPRVKEDSGPLDTLPKTKEPGFTKDKLSKGDTSSPSKERPDANRDATVSGRKSVDTYTPSSHQETPVPTLYEGSGSKATSGFSFVSGLILLLLI